MLHIMALQQATTNCASLQHTPKHSDPIICSNTATSGPLVAGKKAGSKKKHMSVKKFCTACLCTENLVVHWFCLFSWEHTAAPVAKVGAAGRLSNISTDWKRRPARCCRSAAGRFNKLSKAVTNVGEKDVGEAG
jgi:hypothetical protein